MPRKVTAFWWNKKPNFGDALTPLLLSHFGYDVERAEPQDAELCVIGSVLEMLGSDFKGAILGTGFIMDDGPLHFRRARVLALRGPLSAQRAGLDDVAFGDAGLLAPLLIAGRPRAKSARVGLVPHYVDKSHPVLVQLTERHGADIRIIDVQAENAAEIMGQINDCEFVISSSLHGLIAADALNIPSGWVYISGSVIGGGFKFKDYGASIGCVLRSHMIRGDETLDELEALASRKEFDRGGMQSRLTQLFRLIEQL